MTYEQDRFKQIYQTIQAKFPELPDCEVALTQQSLDGAAFYQGRGQDNKARFLLSNTKLYDSTVWHESGHALADVWGNARGPEFWRARGFPGSWDAQLEKTIRLSNSTSPWDKAKVWASNPGEMWCEAFAATYVDGYAERTETFGVLLNKDKMRSFYESATVPISVQLNDAATTTAEWRGPLPGSNFMPGRDGALLDRIVLHHMDGTLAGTHAHFTNPSSQVSAHFGIGRDITVQWVSTGDTAYHAGVWGMNLRSIGIEVEDLGRDEYTDGQYTRAAQLLRDLASTHGIPLDRIHVIGHREVVATACPGTLDIDRIVEEAGGQIDMTRDEVKAVVNEALAEFGLDPDTFKFIKDRLAFDAHHKHDAETSEPKGS